MSELYFSPLPDIVIPTAPQIVSPAIFIPKKEAKREFLGRIGHKDYYLNPDGSVVWRVPDIRESVRAPFGFKIFGGDFSQIEIKIMAFLSGDPFLINAINAKDPKTGKGTDFHCFMTAEINEIPYEEFFFIAKIADGVKQPEHPLHKLYAKMRSNTKTVVFGIPFRINNLRAACLSN